MYSVITSGVPTLPNTDSTLLYFRIIFSSLFDIRANWKPKSMGYCPLGWVPYPPLYVWHHILWWASSMNVPEQLPVFFLGGSTLEYWSLSISWSYSGPDMLPSLLQPGLCWWVLPRTGPCRDGWVSKTFNVSAGTWACLPTQGASSFEVVLYNRHHAIVTLLAKF